jgi:outer membrane protein assembly factor BamB
MLIAIGAVLGTSLPVQGQWVQWGGPDRNFSVQTEGLAQTWPVEGPKVLWRRPLGTGYSGIVVDDGKLFTMFRKKRKDPYEYTIALDAATGETLWQKRNMAVIPRGVADHGKEFTGPNATPLIVGDRLYTLGRNAALYCRQVADGKVVWKHELKRKFHAQLETCGYSCSPIACGQAIIVPVGNGEGGKNDGSALVSFRQTTGEELWRKLSFQINHSSPILITYDGESQYVLCTTTGVIGVKPESGELLWEQPVPEEQFKGVFATPVWNGRDTLYCASREYGFGIRLTKRDGKMISEQLWSNRRTPLGMGTPVLVGDLLVGSKRGTQGLEAPMIGVDLQTGERLWHKRVFPTSALIDAGGRLIILDHLGKLGLATATREGLTVHSQFQLTEKWSFTAPSIVGTKLYVRDEKDILALDLG